MPDEQVLETNTDPSADEIRLDQYDNHSWNRGRPLVVELVWLILGGMFVASRFPGSVHRRWLLRLFGAQLGKGVVIKPGVKVKFPWRLHVGDHSWIGEEVWIDNLADVRIGAHCCISQAAYLCTGSHDWSKSHFDLVVRPIEIGDGAWIAAHASLAPGARVGKGTVLTLASAASGQLEPWTIYSGNPAVSVGTRRVVRFT